MVFSGKNLIDFWYFDGSSKFKIVKFDFVVKLCIMGSKVGDLVWLVEFFVCIEVF